MIMLEEQDGAMMRGSARLSQMWAGFNFDSRQVPYGVEFVNGSFLALRVFQNFNLIRKTTCMKTSKD